MGKIKLFLLMGAPLLPSLAVAQPQFDEWSVSNGAIDPCTNITNAVSCQILVDSDGFTQAQITGTDGQIYIKSVVTDVDANGPKAGLAFYDENFVRMNFSQSSNNTSEPGFMGKQHISDNAANSGTVFTSDAEVRTGWAQGPGDANVVISSSIITTDTAGNPNGAFETTFNFQGNNDPVTGEQLGRRIVIGQDVTLTAGSDTERQVFLFRGHSGNLLTGTGIWGSTTDDPTNIDDPFDIGNPVSWSPGGSVNVFWIGQNVATPGINDGSATFSMLQVNGSASQLVSGLPVPDTGGTLGGFQDWLEGAEAAEFGPAPSL